MLRFIDTQNQIPKSYPVESVHGCNRFEPGQIAGFKRDIKSKKIVVGPSDGTSVIGIIDDIRYQGAPICDDSTAESGKITVWPKCKGIIFKTDQYESDINSLLEMTDNPVLKALTQKRNSINLYISINGKFTTVEEELAEPFGKLIDLDEGGVTVEIL